jgi:hypothetical protein
MTDSDEFTQKSSLILVAFSLFMLVGVFPD